MYTTTNISLAHQVFDVGLIHKSVDTILQIFKKTIPPYLQSNPKFLYERAILLLESPLSLEEKRGSLKRIVVTYPNFYSQQEKESLLIAAKIANVTVPRLVSETEANVKNYGIFRRSDIKDSKRIVAFRFDSVRNQPSNSTFTVYITDQI